MATQETMLELDTMHAEMYKSLGSALIRANQLARTYRANAHVLLDQSTGEFQAHLTAISSYPKNLSYVATVDWRLL